MKSKNRVRKKNNKKGELSMKNEEKMNYKWKTMWRWIGNENQRTNYEFKNKKEGERIKNEKGKVNELGIEIVKNNIRNLRRRENKKWMKKKKRENNLRKKIKRMNVKWKTKRQLVWDEKGNNNQKKN